MKTPGRIVIILGLALLCFSSASLLQKSPSLQVSTLKQVQLNNNDLSISASTSGSGDLKATLQLVGLFFLWYGFNAGYNVYNAFMKRDFQYPGASSAIQLLVGMLYVFPLWILGLRKAPHLKLKDIATILPIAVLNAAGHALTVCATFEKGGGSFTHVIKAAEPVVSVILNLLVNKIVPKPLTAISLLPITYGVAYASTLGQLDVKTIGTELTTKAAKMAMGSNVAFGMRSILRKNLNDEFKARTRLDPANEHAVTTLISFFLIIPFVMFFEGLPTLTNAVSSMSAPLKSSLLSNTFIAGMCFYLYNEMQNKVLGSLGPVPTAVGNTLKRVVIFVALYLFTAGETFPFPKVLGCAIAIAGCLAFAICDSKKL